MTIKSRGMEIPHPETFISKPRLWQNRGPLKGTVVTGDIAWNQPRGNDVLSALLWNNPAIRSKFLEEGGAGPWILVVALPPLY